MKLDARHTVVFDGTGPNRYLGDHLAADRARREMREERHASYLERTA